MDYLFFLAVVKIIWIDILLSGDNAVVIALACKDLGDKKTLGMTLGAGAAVILRIAVTSVIVLVLQIPYVHLVGGLVLLWIASKMLLGEDDVVDDSKPAATKLYKAIGTVVAADIVMSIDNVVAVAAAANGSILLIAFGLVLSIPLVVSGASVISMVIDKFPILVWAGAGLLGYIAGETIMSDPAMLLLLPGAEQLNPVWGMLGAAMVLAFGLIERHVARFNNA